MLSITKRVILRQRNCGLSELAVLKDFLKKVLVMDFQLALETHLGAIKVVFLRTYLNLSLRMET